MCVLSRFAIGSFTHSGTANFIFVRSIEALLVYELQHCLSMTNWPKDVSFLRLYEERRVWGPRRKPRQQIMICAFAYGGPSLKWVLWCLHLSLFASCCICVFICICYLDLIHTFDKNTSTAHDDRDWLVFVSE